MRSLFIFFLILASVIAFGQEELKTKLKLTTGDCRNSKTVPYFGVDTIFFYKLPEDTFAFNIILKKFKSFSIQLENITVSNYKMKYKNIFDQEVVKNIILTKQDLNNIIICPDTLKGYTQNTLVNLNDNDTVTINFQSQGCFHNYSSKILITKEVDNYKARLCNVVEHYEKKKGKRTIRYGSDSVLQTATLTNKNIQDFIRFENELNYTKNGGCTTIDWYEIKSKYLNIKKTDGSCMWSGYFYLCKSFFGDQAYRY